MIISFLSDPRDGVRLIPLTIEDSRDGPFGRVLYDACCKSLSGIVSPISLVVIPDKISASIVYSPKALIRHIRFDASPDVARVPILVVGPDALSEFSDDDEYEDFEAIGVGFEALLHADLTAISIPSVDERRFSELLEASGNRPERDAGQHDEANRWGAYALLRGLEYAGGGLAATADAVCCELREDIFYKKKLRTLTKLDVTPSRRKNLQERRGKMLRLLSTLDAPLRVLVVEDQLDRGWDVAYRALLPKAAITFARTLEEACRNVEQSTQLIILDVRLAVDEVTSADGDAHPRAGGFSGVKFAEYVRERKNWAPIIVATASNKVWTLEALLKYGINGYWVKLAAEDTHAPDTFVENALGLVDRVLDVLTWSLMTRAWIDAVYAIAIDVAKGSDRDAAAEITGKAREFHALMHEPFNPFSNAIAEGVQLDLAFLIAFSMINELISWCCERNRGTGELLLNLGGDLKVQILSEKRDSKSGVQYLLNEAFAIGHGMGPGPPGTFPDVRVFRAILNAAGLPNESDAFRRLNKVRNGLSVTHGKLDRTFEKAAERPSSAHIGQLLRVLGSLVTRVRERRTAPTQ